MALIESMVHQLSSNAPGTGDVSLPVTAASAGRRTLLAAIGDGNQCYYFIEGTDGSEWGKGTVTGTTTGTLARNTVIKNSLGTTAKLNFSGIVNVWVGLPAEKVLWLDNDLVAGDILYATGPRALARLPKGTDGQALILASGLPSWVTSSGGVPVAPQGRLTLTSGVPVLSSDVTGATTIYYEPCVGDRIPIYDGTSFTMKTFAALSQTLADTTKSPAASAASKNYDMFVWDDGGTMRLSRGPAWASDTAEPSGSGTSETIRQNGFRVNKYAITNGPAASRGTYVGTIGTNASNSVDVMMQPAAAANGTANFIGLWNAYNRVSIAAVCRDSTDSWTYTVLTLRAKNNSTSNRVTVITGRPEGIIDALCLVSAYNNSGAATNIFVNIGLNSVTAGANGSLSSFSGSNAFINTVFAQLRIPAPVGRNYFQALEASAANPTTNFFGDAGASFVQTGLTLALEA